MRYKAVLCAVLFCVSAITMHRAFAAADDVTQLQKQIEERRTHISNLQKQIDALKKSLQNKQLERISLQNQMQIIGGRLEKTKLDIRATQEKIDTTELTIKETELKIVEKERAVRDDQAYIGELMRELEFGERQTLVSVFAHGRTLSDFFSAQDSFEQVDAEMTKALISVLLAKKELELHKEELSLRKKELVDSRLALESNEERLRHQNTAKAQLLTETRQSEEKFQKMVSDLKRQYAATEGEIASIERDMRAKLAKAGKKSGLVQGEVKFQWPVPSRVVTALYHDPDYPFRHVFEHPGLDIRASQGTPIRATASGIVARAKNAGMGYSYIMLVHNNQLSSLYGHVSRILVSEDEVVAAGDIIGYSGGTPGTPGAGPFVTGPHLHFEIRSGGLPVNPLDYLP